MSIEIEELHFSYGDREVLHGISMKIEPGEIYGLLGPNGAGKTTTLKVLVGLLRAGNGGVRIAGHDLSRDADKAKQSTAYVPDKPHLYERLTGWEYLEFVAGLWQVRRDPSWKERARNELERFGLIDVRDQLIESYSLGMRQKLLFVAGLLHDPQVWILDEPVSGLDPHAIRMLRGFLGDEAKAGKAIVLSTHTMDMAERLCHRIGIIHEGRLIAEGNMERLRELARRSLQSHDSLEDLFVALTEKKIEKI